MESFIARIKSETGLHARPVIQLIKTVKEFAAEVKMEKAGKIVDAKKMLGILSLDVRKGDTIKIIIEGPDEKEAAIALKNLINEY